jgi:hypothetical protein
VDGWDEWVRVDGWVGSASTCGRGGRVLRDQAREGCGAGVVAAARVIGVQRALVPAPATPANLLRGAPFTTHAASDGALVPPACRLPSWRRSCRLWPRSASACWSALHSWRLRWVLRLLGLLGSGDALSTMGLHAAAAAGGNDPGMPHVPVCQRHGGLLGGQQQKKGNDLPARPLLCLPACLPAAG